VGEQRHKGGKSPARSNIQNVAGEYRQGLAVKAEQVTVLIRAPKQLVADDFSCENAESYPVAAIA
jgi:hypothetical protein